MTATATAIATRIAARIAARIVTAIAARVAPAPYTIEPMAQGLIEAVTPMAAPVTPVEPVATVLPGQDAIDEAAALFVPARTARNAGDREMRKARKVLDLLPAGQYGNVTIGREVKGVHADMDEIERVFKDLGREVPYLPNAASLTVAIGC